MSKFTQIQDALRTIDQATFQQLCDAYLVRREYKAINPFGLVIGKDKTAKGTPDTLLVRDDGRYDFAECTTQEGSLAAKFEADLDKCLDPSKTGIPLEKIREIVLCHISRFDPSDESRLTDKCAEHGIILSIFGPGTISHDLYRNHPGLARDFLGVEVDTGQIHSVDDFVTLYDRGAAATPLDTAFRFREDELARGVSALESQAVVLVTGAAGIGKSRLALECGRSYVRAYSDTRFYCVMGRGPDLYQDLRVYLSAPGDYLIYVDDANRVSHFEYVVEILREQRPDRTVRVIATVRDYAFDSVNTTSRERGVVEVIELRPFSEAQIRDFVKAEFGVNNDLYLDRIADISGGNPRLAVMSARVALRDESLLCIFDVTALYDEYFSSIHRDLADLHDETLVRVAGLIAFFRSLELSNAEFMDQIQTAVGLDAKTIREAARRLHELEFADMYGGDIVKISDQVLATYLFYVAVFRQRSLRVSALVDHFYPRYRNLFVDSLNPVIGAFDSAAIAAEVARELDERWRCLEKQGAIAGLLELADVFAFARPTEALLAVRRAIAELEAGPIPTEDLVFERGRDGASRGSIPAVLSQFNRFDRQLVGPAVDLLLDYFERRPVDASTVLRILTEQFGPDQYSSLTNYAVERIVIETLWRRASEGASVLASHLFVAVAGHYLGLRFIVNEMRGNTMKMIHFSVVDEPELVELRAIVWQNLFALATVPGLFNRVLEALTRYCSHWEPSFNREVLATDSNHVFEFMRSSLDRAAYRHCVLVNRYFEMLKIFEIAGDGSLRDEFSGPTFAVSRLLFNDRDERLEFGWEEQAKRRRERIAEHTATFDAADFERLFDQCAEILREQGTPPNSYQVGGGVRLALLALAGRDHALYEVVLSQYLYRGNFLELDRRELMAVLIERCGAETAFRIVAEGDYAERSQWLLAYYIVLPAVAVTRNHLQELYRLYETTPTSELYGGLEYLQKYSAIDGGVYVSVVRHLLKPRPLDSSVGRLLGDLFRQGSTLLPRLGELFAGETQLLRTAYLALTTADPTSDYQGAGFRVLLDLDTGWIEAWVAWLYEHEDRRPYGSHRDLSRVWLRDDHAEIVTRALEESLRHERPFLDTNLQDFFVPRSEDPNLELIRDRQIAFLQDLIRRRPWEVELMELVFGIASDWSAERRRALVAEFVQQNDDFESFQRLPLGPLHGSWMGSAVPWYESQAAFYESLLPLFDRVELLPHRDLVGRSVRGQREAAEREKRRDFREG